MNSAMIDCETLATTPDSVIVALAAVEFNPFEITQDLVSLPHLFLLIDTETQTTRRVDDDAVAWWATQPTEITDLIFRETGRVSLSDALRALQKFCWGKSRIFAQGTDFDCTIISHACRELNLPVPWSYNQARDSRTIRDLVELPKPSANHNPLDDCFGQITGVQQTLNKLGITKFAG